MKALRLNGRLSETVLSKTPGVRDPEGKLHSAKQRPEIFRKYLAQHVWKSAEEQVPPQNPLHSVIPEIFRPPFEEDLYRRMKQLQAGKATGPDMIPAELIKRVPYVVQMFLLLSHYNKCLRMGSIPDGWLLSEVVKLVKDSRKDTQPGISNMRTTRTNVKLIGTTEWTSPFVAVSCS